MSVQDSGNTQSKPGENSGATTPACDQCRLRKVRCDRISPKCSNCSKAGVECGFSNRGKRINHTKQLVEDFSSLATRLDSIDVSIAQLRQQQVPSSIPSTSNASASSSDTPSEFNDFVHFIPGAARESEDDSDKPSLRLSEQLGNAHHKILESGAEVFHGILDIRSLLEVSRTKLRKLTDRMESTLYARPGQAYSSAAYQESTSLKDQSRSLDQTFPFQNTTTTTAIATTEDNHIACPPQKFLEECLEVFLTEINTAWPIFDESHLRAAVEQHYQPTTSQPSEEAWNLCFINIMLLEKGLQLRRANVGACPSRELNSELWMFFLNSARRGLTKLDWLSEPRLINVQTLVTLALVAGEFWERSVHEKLLQLACQVGRSMGLHQAPRRKNYIESEEWKLVERKQLFWTLYSLDKQRASVSGQPCDLYLFDSDLSLLDDASAQPAGERRPPCLHILALMEDIYLHLYSPRSLRVSIATRERQASCLGTQLKEWANHNQQFLTEPENSEASSMILLRIELLYSYQLARLLLQSSSIAGIDLQEQRNAARVALRLIVGLAQRLNNTSCFMLLGRVLRYHSMIAFHVVHSNTLHHDTPDASADTELLYNVVQAVRPFLYPETGDTYYRNLYEGMKWWMEMARMSRTITQQFSYLSELQTRGQRASGASSPDRMNGNQNRSSPPMKRPLDYSTADVNHSAQPHPSVRSRQASVENPNAPYNQNENASMPNLAAAAGVNLDFDLDASNMEPQFAGDLAGLLTPHLPFDDRFITDDFTQVNQLPRNFRRDDSMPFVMGLADITNSPSGASGSLAKAVNPPGSSSTNTLGIRPKSGTANPNSVLSPITNGPDTFMNMENGLNIDFFREALGPEWKPG